MIIAVEIMYMIFDFSYEILIFFIILDIILQNIYKNYLKVNMYKKMEYIEAFLKGETEKLEILEEEKKIKRFYDTLIEWQKTNEKNLKKLNREKEILNQILSSIDSSVSLFDENLNLIIKNNKISYLYKSDADILKEKVKDKEILEVLEQARKDKKNQKKDIYIQSLKRHFYVKVKVLKEYNRYLLSVKDVTKERGIIEVQKDFISNVSHELKTPLTNLKGYIIALEDAPETLKSKFIQTIKNNIDKLENIIIDFLNITKIEKTNIVNIQKIEFEKLKKELELVLEERIKKSNAKINYNLNLLKDKKMLRIDFEKVLTILKNLVENAIIYKGEQEPKIEITILETDSRYKIGVKDNGIGIDVSEKDMIFERFYRVDKARTSNKAGTGLGLAIVKELVEKCGGKIEVISKEGKGSIFIFTILK